MGEVRANPLVKNPLNPKLVLELDACVDTGAVMLLLLGRDIIDRLEIPITGRAVVILADDSKQEMDRAGPVFVQINDRSGHFDCLVGPVGCEPLIGQIVLESLDFIVDCGRQQLRPRPDSPAYPSYKLK